MRLRPVSVVLGLGMLEGAGTQQGSATMSWLVGMYVVARGGLVLMVVCIVLSEQFLGARSWVERARVVGGMKRGMVSFA